MTIENKLKELGIVLPENAAPPAANYVPFVQSGPLVFLSGQLPIVEGKIAFTGKVGFNVTLEQAQEAAKACAVQILAWLKVACDGKLDRVVRCVKLGGFVNSHTDFVDQPKVINGASDLLVAVLGDKGRHARFAVSAPALPFDATVEIDAVFEIAA